MDPQSPFTSSQTPQETPAPQPIQERLPAPEKKKSLKGLVVVLTILLLAVGAALAYVLFTGVSLGTKPASSTAAYAIDLTPAALAVPLNEQKEAKDGVTTLSINDLSDTFSDKYLTIPEWGLQIKTKYADLLEYSYEARDDAWEAGSTPYAACNGEYLFCDSLVQVKIKAEYLKPVKDSSGVEGPAADRTVAYIFQDNRSLSQAGETKARYWSNEAFTTEFGTQGTLIFEQASPAGIDELGKVFCPAELTIFLDSATPCEDFFMSIYAFDASKPDAVTE